MAMPTLVYKPGWSFRMGGPGGRFLCCFATTPDSLDPGRLRCTQHMREVPPEVERGDAKAWARWVLDFLMDIEAHETAEFLQVGGHRPFWPNHAEGDPYERVENWPER